MAETRGRLGFIFRPQGVEKELSFMTRVGFARFGANGLSEITPQTLPELDAMLQTVSRNANIPTPRAFVWHSAKPVANAVAIAGKVPIVAFSETIIDLLNDQELAAVAAHELGHVRNIDHATKLALLSGVGGGATAWVATRPLKAIENQLKRPPSNGTAAFGVSFAKDFLIITGFLAGAALASRSEEYAADRYGAMLMQGDGTPLMSALQKLEEHNSQNFRPGFMSKVLNPFNKLTRSHPTFAQRHDALGVTREEVGAYRSLTEGNAAAVQAQMAGETAPPSYPMAEAQRNASPTDWQQRVGNAVERENLTLLR